MRRPDRIDDLALISALQLQEAQSAMSAVLRRETSLRENLADLVRRKQDRAESRRDPDEPATVAGADIRWHRWVDQQRATINAELAQVLAQKESVRKKLKVAFGRHHAVEALQARAHNERRQNLWRRLDYES